MDNLQYESYQDLSLGYHSFKPYYKWIIFNIWEKILNRVNGVNVLNLIING